MALLELFADARRERPRAVAIATPGPDGGAGEIGYRELFDAVDRVASRLTAPGALVDPGLAPGERVAVLAGNRPEATVALLGVLTAGGVAVPVNTAYTAAEIAYRLADSAARLVIVEDAYREVAREAIAALDGPPAGIDLDALAGPTALAPTPARPGPDDPALLAYTSGTTGRSQGAMLTHGNLAATVTALRRAWRWSPADRLLLTLQLFHVHGLGQSAPAPSR